MQYSKEDLFNAVVAIIPDFETPLRNGSIYMPNACRHAAMECFIWDRGPDEHTLVLRQAMQDLSRNAQFYYHE